MEGEGCGKGTAQGAVAGWGSWQHTGLPCEREGSGARCTCAAFAPRSRGSRSRARAAGRFCLDEKARAWANELVGAGDAYEALHPACKLFVALPFMHEESLEGQQARPVRRTPAAHPPRSRGPSAALPHRPGAPAPFGRRRRRCAKRKRLSNKKGAATILVRAVSGLKIDRC